MLKLFGSRVSPEQTPHPIRSQQMPDTEVLVVDLYLFQTQAQQQVAEADVPLATEQGRPKSSVTS